MASADEEDRLVQVVGKEVVEQLEQPPVVLHAHELSFLPEQAHSIEHVSAVEQCGVAEGDPFVQQVLELLPFGGQASEAVGVVGLHPAFNTPFVALVQESIATGVDDVDLMTLEVVNSMGDALGEHDVVVVQDRQHVTGRRCQTTVAGTGDATIDAVAQETELDILGEQPLARPPHVLRCAIGTRVVHKHDLQGSVGLVAEAHEGFVQVRHGIVGGNDHTDLRRRAHVVSPPIGPPRAALQRTRSPQQSILFDHDKNWRLEFMIGRGGRGTNGAYLHGEHPRSSRRGAGRDH